MTTEHAAREAMDSVRAAIGPDLHVFLPAGADSPDVALTATAGLLVEAFLSGVAASMRGRLADWTAGVTAWITDQLHSTVTGLDGAGQPERRLVLGRSERWIEHEAVTAVQSAAWETLAAIEDVRDPARPVPVVEHSQAVRDALAVALGATGIEAGASARYADVVSAASTPLLGVRRP